MKNKTKRIWIIFTIASIVFILIGVTAFYFIHNPILKNPHTNLEFWIGDKVEFSDFSDYESKDGLMGGYQYYGKGYVPTLDEHNQQVDPEHCVVYTITNYPDYSSPNLHISRIEITDPEIELYGITINSTPDDFKSAMSKNGFSVTERFFRDGKCYYGKKGRFTICFSDMSQNKSITISAKVTNKFGIVF